MEQLLTTKLHIPSIRPKFVHRTRLIEQLNAGLHRKLTLISAPAGFGKTTLVSEWVAKLRLDAPNKNELVNKITWLSLDEGDNDPARFLAYLIGALNQSEGLKTVLGQGALDMLQAPQAPPAEAVMTSLINDVVACQERIVLVLDDYHLIENRLIHDALSFLLDHQPPQLQLVLVTRVDPPFPLARLRARDQLTELRAADLRFQAAEAAEFLNTVMGLTLSNEDIAALETRTEGWIAGLQLAAISIRGSADTANLIHSFTGSHRFILDYLIEEVLEQQSESVQHFLLQTAILDRFTSGLCDALTGQNNGQGTLEMLDQANLFIVPLDEGQRWYRYHHLFGGLLRQRLGQTLRDSVPILHNRASEWFEGEGLDDEAIDHALRAQDYQRAVQQIERVAEREFVQGEDSKLRRWLDELPIEFVCSKPKLCIIQAWHLLASGALDEAERFLIQAELALNPPPEDIIETSRPERGKIPASGNLPFRGRIEVTRAFAAFYRGDITRIIDHAQNALEYLPADDLTWRSTATHVLGDAYDIQGKMKEVYQYRLKGVEASKAAGNSFLVMIASLKLAIALRHQGQLARVTEICTQQWVLAREVGLQNTVVAGWLLGIWGEVLAELNDLEEAKRLGEKGTELTTLGGDLAMLAWSQICLIRVFFSSRDLNGAEAIIANLEKTARKNFVPPGSWTMPLPGKRACGWLGTHWRPPNNG